MKRNGGLIQSDKAAKALVHSYDVIGDIALVEIPEGRKKDRKKICILRDKVTTSARRWQQDGALYTTVRNQVFVALFHLGVSPYRLARYYWK